MNKTKRQQVINQQVLDRLGPDDEFLQEATVEVKPSRIDSRRARSEQHEVKKARRKNFQEFND